MNEPTAAQKKAIAARGNVLVVAGAGAGKTRTLVERCLSFLLDPKTSGSLDEVLMVTFTEAAAAEMRKRLRDGLASLPEQLALLDTAHICTLHSFCFHLVRQHFYQLGLDPQLTVLPEEQTQLLVREALDAVLEENYRSETPAALAIQSLVQAQGRDWDEPARKLIRRLHEYAQTLRDPAGWFEAQEARFRQTEPKEWREWLLAELSRWRAAWLPLLQSQPADNKNAHHCAKILAGLSPQPTREEFAAALVAIGEADLLWPKPKERWRGPIEEIFSEAEFLYSVCAVAKTDPLAEDWEWVRPQMLALLDLARQFDRAFAAAKREAGGMDYHDLEQFALRLLWDKGQPSAIARAWRKKLRLIFVDEYQDINGAQEAIIEALGGDGKEANRFLVGDVKQSIYRFRLADPRIFLKYHSAWNEDKEAKVIALSENFRSHETILDFVNAVFESLMHQDLGGIHYDENARLRFGRGGTGENSGSRVEMHLRCTEPDDDDETFSDTEIEARMVGRRLLELKSETVSWCDMVVLLRSPRYKVEAYVKEFTRLGVPLVATRGGFYESLEVSDLLSLLHLLDNPLQDLPLLQVLRSPLAGLTVEELANIRVAHRKGRFWEALQAANSGFLKRFHAWRQWARQRSVSQCLETILDETHYLDWLATQTRGEQRRANVERLLQLAREFDDGQGEGLYRFLRMVDAQQEAEVEMEPAATPATDAVRLMSIHQSKGLEFPIVVLADLGKAFNLMDTHGKIILDEEFGLCPQVKPPDMPRFYPSLPYWLAQRRQKRETYGEELRLLYVAMTRAQERLILAGTTSRKRVEENWPGAAARGLGPSEILKAKSYLDWLGIWFVKHRDDQLLAWRIYERDKLATESTEAASHAKAPGADLPPEVLGQIRQRLDWRYPFITATEKPAKTSVSALRREMDEEAKPFFSFMIPTTTGELDAAKIGSAHHTFLEVVSLELVGSVAALREEARRLQREKILTAEEADSLDFEALADFWQSAVGRQLLGNIGHLRRELPFTARFEEGDHPKFAGMGAEEFVIVQGVVDLAVILPGEIWLLDFKTDHFPANELDKKIEQYRGQLALYAQAVSRTYRRPVTKRWLHFLNARKTVEV